MRVALASLRRPGPGSDVGRTDRGDVPGWVLITVMSAGLVAALWVLAEDQLKALFTDAVNSVTAGP
ncbi:MAG: hypothetical protein CSA84_00410 [Actinomycetales bacterium]|nr:MAG: hypothetical protein CSA84_00410 [Actinomycetales bacterium]